MGLLDNIYNFTIPDYLTGLNNLLNAYLTDHKTRMLKMSCLEFSIKYDKKAGLWYIEQKNAGAIFRWCAIDDKLRQIDESFEVIDIEEPEQEQEPLCKYCGKNFAIFDRFCSDCMKHYSSEKYLCADCLRQGKFKKGSVRYDSLVLCQRHNEKFRPIVQKLYKAIGVEK